jgi:hypothetical protein
MGGRMGKVINILILEHFKIHSIFDAHSKIPEARAKASNAFRIKILSETVI